MWSYTSTPLCTILRCRNNAHFTLPSNSSTVIQLSHNEPRCMVVGIGVVAMGLWSSFGSILIVSNVTVFLCYCKERQLCRDD